MAKKRETIFKEKIKPQIESLPRTWVEKIQQVCIRGTPDFLCCINGCFVALELKADDKSNLDELQRWKLKKIADSGGVGVVVTPENWDVTYAFLHEIAHHGLERASELYN